MSEIFVDTKGQPFGTSLDGCIFCRFVFLTIFRFYGLPLHLLEEGLFFFFFFNFGMVVLRLSGLLILFSPRRFSRSFLARRFWS